VPRKKRVLKKPVKEEKLGLKRGRKRRLDESGEGCESGGESDSKNFYFDGGEDEVLEGGSVAGKTTPLSTSSSSTSTSTSSSSSASTSRKFDFSSIAIHTTEDLKLSWKDSLLDSMAFAHTDDESKESGSSGSADAQEEEADQFCFDLGKSSDDERCLEEIPQEMVRELTELRSYNSTLQDMIKDVQQFNSYQRKKRRQWELSKINNGTASSNSTTSGGSLGATAAPSDALPQWLVSDFSSLSNKLVDLSSDLHSSSSSSSSSSASSAVAAHHARSVAGGEEGELDYLGAWQQSMPNHGAPLQLPTQLALLAGHHSMLQLPSQLQQQPQQQQPPPANAPAPQDGPAPFTTSLPFTEV
jgi:hypothetical protein